MPPWSTVMMASAALSRIASRRASRSRRRAVLSRHLGLDLGALAADHQQQRAQQPGQQQAAGQHEPALPAGVGLQVGRRRRQPQQVGAPAEGQFAAVVDLAPRAPDAVDDGGRGRARRGVAERHQEMRRSRPGAAPAPRSGRPPAVSTSTPAGGARARVAGGDLQQVDRARAVLAASAMVRLAIGRPVASAWPSARARFGSDRKSRPSSSVPVFGLDQQHRVVKRAPRGRMRQVVGAGIDDRVRLAVEAAGPALDAASRSRCGTRGSQPIASSSGRCAR